MNGGSDVVSIESYYYITQVLGLGLGFCWAVVFLLTYFRFRYVVRSHWGLFKRLVQVLETVSSTVVF